MSGEIIPSFCLGWGSWKCINYYATGSGSTTGCKLSGSPLANGTSCPHTSGGGPLATVSIDPKEGISPFTVTVKVDINSCKGKYGWWYDIAPLGNFGFIVYRVLIKFINLGNYQEYDIDLDPSDRFVAVSLTRTHSSTIRESDSDPTSYTIEVITTSKICPPDTSYEITSVETQTFTDVIVLHKDTINPTISLINPNYILRDSIPTDLAITGQYFVNGMITRLESLQTNDKIIIPNTFNSSTSMELNVSDVSDLVDKNYQLIIRTSDGSSSNYNIQNGSATIAVTVYDGLPNITSVLPVSMRMGNTESLVVSGTNLKDVTAITLNPSMGSATNLNIYPQGDMIVSSYVPATTGTITSVTVTSPCGSDTYSCSIPVTGGSAILPVVYNFSPTKNDDATSLVVNIIGANFTNTCTVRMEKGAYTKDFGITYVDSSHISFTFALTDQTEGDYTIYVRNSTGGTGTAPSKFTVSIAGDQPVGDVVIDSVFPMRLKSGDTNDIEMKGTNLDKIINIRYRNGTTITATDLECDSNGETLTYEVEIP